LVFETYFKGVFEMENEILDKAIKKDCPQKMTLNLINCYSVAFGGALWLCLLG